MLQPDYTFRAYRDLTPEFLAERGITVLLSDIDNTLAPYEQALPDGAIKAWLEAMRAAGITVAFLSNNHAPRVELFNGELGAPLRYNAHKPLPRTAKALLRELGATKGSAAMLGDQIFTDVLCAKLTGMTSILVPPIKDRTDKGTRFKRYLERGILRRYYKKHVGSPDVRLGTTIIFKEEDLA